MYRRNVDFGAKNQAVSDEMGLGKRVGSAKRVYVHIATEPRSAES